LAEAIFERAPRMRRRERAEGGNDDTVTAV
jgi:hypothetical protein